MVNSRPSIYVGKRRLIVDFSAELWEDRPARIEWAKRCVFDDLREIGCRLVSHITAVWEREGEGYRVKLIFDCEQGTGVNPDASPTEVVFLEGPAIDNDTLLSLPVSTTLRAKKDWDISDAEIESVAQFIADLVEEGGWDHMSSDDSEKAVAKIRELIQKAEQPK